MKYIEKGKAAKKASFQLIGKTTAEKNKALARIAEQLLIDQKEILIENEKDLQQGKAKGTFRFCIRSNHA